MGANSKVEWCHHTHNAWIGCERVSPECDFCYADAGSRRLAAQHRLKLWDDGSSRYLTSDGYWRQPFVWDRAARRAGERHRVFCASYSDVGEDRPELVAPRARLIDLIPRTPHLDWLLLTKRPENLVRLFAAWGDRWPRNVWAGTTVGVNASLARLDHLKRVPAFRRFVSMEPLLEAIDIGIDLESTSNRFGWFTCLKCRGWGGFLTSLYPDANGNEQTNTCDACWSSGCAIDWCIIGSESGPHRRPMDVTWARSLVDECVEAGVPVFTKQIATPEGIAAGDRKGGDPAYWPPGNWPREFPELCVDFPKLDPIGGPSCT